MPPKTPSNAAPTPAPAMPQSAPSARPATAALALTFLAGALVGAGGMYVITRVASPAGEAPSVTVPGIPHATGPTDSATGENVGQPAPSRGNTFISGKITAISDGSVTVEEPIAVEGAAPRTFTVRLTATTVLKAETTKDAATLNAERKAYEKDPVGPPPSETTAKDITAADLKVGDFVNVSTVDDLATPGGAAAERIEVVPEPPLIVRPAPTPATAPEASVAPTPVPSEPTVSDQQAPPPSAAQ